MVETIERFNAKSQFKVKLRELHHDVIHSAFYMVGIFKGHMIDSGSSCVVQTEPIGWNTRVFLNYMFVIHVFPHFLVESELK